MPYTATCNAALDMGYTRDDLLEMTWGELVVSLQVHAQRYETNSGPKKASEEQVLAWMGR